MEDWAYLFIPMGIVFIAMAIATVAVFTRRHIKWTRAQGTITSVKEKKPGAQENDPNIIIKYRYTDTRGKTHGGSCTRIFRKPKKGSSLAIIYDPECPERSETAGLSIVFAIALVLVALGIFVLLGAFGVIDGTSSDVPPHMY